MEQNVLLKNHTTFKIGGPARYFSTVKTVNELLELTDFARKNHLPLLVLGGGSNLLIDDRPQNCLALKIDFEFPPEIIDDSEGIRIRVSGSNSLQSVVNFCAANGLKGLETLAGIPGSVGGAICGNAGAYGTSISSRLLNCKILYPENDKPLTQV